MKALIQRVTHASVKVNNRVAGEISKGILIFLGIREEDTLEDIKYLVDKITNLRIFENGDKRMDKSVKDIGGELLIIPQFTLYGSTRKGRRPDFTQAASPEKANDLYEKFIDECKKTGLKTESGEFAAMMDISLLNNGPVTFLLDSKEKN